MENPKYLVPHGIQDTYKLSELMTIVVPDGSKEFPTSSKNPVKSRLSADFLEKDLSPLVRDVFRKNDQNRHLFRKDFGKISEEHKSVNACRSNALDHKVIFFIT